MSKGHQSLGYIQSKQSYPKKSSRIDCPWPFKKLNHVEKSTILTFSDTVFKNFLGGAFQRGYLILLADKAENTCPIHWQSQKRRKIIKSSLAAECLALQVKQHSRGNSNQMLYWLTTFFQNPWRKEVDTGWSHYKGYDDKGRNQWGLPHWFAPEANWLTPWQKLQHQSWHDVLQQGNIIPEH